MNNETENRTALILAIIATPFALWFGGHVTADLWRWFLVPVGVPAIGTAHAMGMSVLVSGFVVQGTSDKEKTYFQTLLASVTSKLVFWGVGAIIRFWVMQ